MSVKQQQKQGSITVFFSYAQTDRAMRDRLAIHLSQLKRDGQIEEWSDQQILAGSDRAQENLQAIHSAQIILLLISADFLASDAKYEIELQQALERHRRGEARVVPIIVRPCDWRESLFAHLQCLPRNEKPIVTWSNRDEAFLSIAQELRRIISQEQFSPPPLSRVPRRNRERLLKRVRDTWITGLLDQSLHQAAWLELHFQDQPNALENPWRLEVQELNHPSRSLPMGTTIAQVYDEADGKLLILGEAGAGKTTLLLHLTRTLLDYAEADERHPMPVVFPLSSWAKLRQPLAQWFVEELSSPKYQVPPKVAQQWVETNQILPLLDGLDEVAESARIACIQEINAYCSQHPSQTGTSLVVCCRRQEYQALSMHLLLNQAVSIQPLTDEQIEMYLSTAQGQLEGLQQALRDDAELYELARRPLLLSIFTLAYRGENAADLPTAPTQEQKLRAVFESYVKRVLTRRGHLPSGKQAQMLHWLISLARQMDRQHQTVFSVEDLQQNWLPRSYQRLYRWSFRLLVGLVFGLLGGLPFGLLGGLFGGLVSGLTTAALS